MVANVFNLCISGIDQLYSIGVRQCIQLVYHNFSKTGAGRANLKGVPCNADTIGQTVYCLLLPLMLITHSDQDVGTIYRKDRKTNDRNGSNSLRRFDKKQSTGIKP